MPYLPIDPTHVGRTLRGGDPGQQPVRQGRRRLHHGDRARLRPARAGCRSSSPRRSRPSPRTPAPRSAPAPCGTPSRREYLPDDATIVLESHELRSAADGQTTITAQLVVDGEHHTVTGRATAPSTPSCGRPRDGLERRDRRRRLRRARDGRRAPMPPPSPTSRPSTAPARPAGASAPTPAPSPRPSGRWRPRSAVNGGPNLATWHGSSAGSWSSPSWGPPRRPPCGRSGVAPR